jgi:predicted transposase YdaD
MHLVLRGKENLTVVTRLRIDQRGRRETVVMIVGLMSLIVVVMRRILCKMKILLLLLVMVRRGEMLEIIFLLRTLVSVRMLQLTQLFLLLPVQLLRIMKGLLLLLLRRVDSDRRGRGLMRM